MTSCLVYACTAAIGLSVSAAEPGTWTASGPPGGTPDANNQSVEIWSVHQDEGMGNGFYSDTEERRRKTPQAHQPHTVMILAVLVTGEGAYQASFQGDTWKGRLEGEIAAVQVFNADAGPDSDQYVRRLQVGNGAALP